MLFSPAALFLSQKEKYLVPYHTTQLWPFHFMPVPFHLYVNRAPLLAHDFMQMRAHCLPESGGCA